MKTILITSCLILAGVCVSQASIMAQWTFESSQPATSGPFAAENGIFAGTSQASGFHANPTSTTYSSPPGAGSAHSFSSKNWTLGDYYQFTTSTLGYNDVTVSFEAAGSGTGPKNFQIAYSLDGSSFTVLDDYIVPINDSPNTPWSAGMNITDVVPYTFSFDFSTTSALNDQSLVYFRLIDSCTTSINGDTVGGGGTSRVDDFTISASLIPTNPGSTVSVPEPATFMAGALLALPVFLRGLRRVWRGQA
jgi:hypothetical protein